MTSYGAAVLFFSAVYTDIPPVATAWLADAGGDGSALVFASNAQLELLQSATQIYFDATFKKTNFNAYSSVFRLYTWYHVFHSRDFSRPVSAGLVMLQATHAFISHAHKSPATLSLVHITRNTPAHTTVLINLLINYNWNSSDLNNNLLIYITILLTPLTLLVTLASFSTNISHSPTKSLHCLNLAILTFVNFAASVLALIPKHAVSLQPP